MYVYLKISYWTKPIQTVNYLMTRNSDFLLKRISYKFIILSVKWEMALNKEKRGKNGKKECEDDLSV